MTITNKQIMDKLGLMTGLIVKGVEQGVGIEAGIRGLETGLKVVNKRVINTERETADILKKLKTMSNMVSETDVIVGNLEEIAKRSKIRTCKHGWLVREQSISQTPACCTTADAKRVCVNCGKVEYGAFSIDSFWDRRAYKRFIKGK